jgi:hypothetical protein
MSPAMCPPCLRYVQELPDPKLRKAALTAKLEIVGDMLATVTEAVNSQDLSADTAREQITDIEEHLRVSTAALAEASERIRDLQRQRRSLSADQQAVESRTLVLDQLLRRFELLRQSYDSDLRRLDFVSEADDLFQQLQTVACPLCGSDLAKHALITACARATDVSDSQVRTACDAERAKIGALLADLSSTIGVLQEEAAERTKRLAELHAQIADIDMTLSSALAPSAALHEAEVAERLELRRKLDAVLAAYQRMDELQRLQVQLDKALREPPRRRDPGPDLGAELHAFTKEIEALLKQWKWADDGTRVGFDRKAWDIEINGQARKSNGKGVRALVHSAFTLGLLRHCRTRNLPHAGFVVLDSPLTAYKERKGTAGPKEVHDAFFSSVATEFKDNQVIILENKEPSDAVKPLLHFVDFAGDARFGRVGFFNPPPEEGDAIKSSADEE